MPKLAITLSAAALLALTAVSAAHTVSLNDGWRFHRGQAAGAEAPRFDDSTWRTVDLPHDFSIEGTSPAKAPQDRSTPEGSSVGYLRGGIGWYRLHLDGIRLRQPGAELIVDGAMQDSDLWVNGTHVAFQPNGYIPIRVEVGSLLTHDHDNVIAIRVVNPDENSRWYSGSGLYRSVALRTHGPVYLPSWGARVETLRLHGSEARLQVRVTLCNQDSAGHDLEVDCQIKSPSGGLTHHSLCTVRAAAGSSETINETVDLHQVEPWELDHPRLYHAKFRILEHGRVVDTLPVTFGVRTIEVSASKGFLLNGRPIKLRGACLHSDNGILGAAAFPAAEDRRVRLMKECGFNAIRTSHNPPSTAFLDSCDRRGVLVIDEFTDVWELPKKRNGYQRYFDAHWRHDLGAMIARDYNHPSVVMWSVGNEIPERTTEAGIRIERQLVQFVHRADSTRPVTAAIPYIYDYPEITEHWKGNYPALAALDVAGYNYAWPEYGNDHARFPNWVMMQTESYPRDALQIWRETDRLPYVIGDFVWSGMDYLGESGIGHSTYIPSAADPATTGQSDWEQMPWPWWISWCGDLDITGVKKPQSYYRDVVWGLSPVQICVHEPIPAGMKEKVGPWGWPAERPEWTWPVKDGTPMTVSVYTSAPHVRLMLNGRTVGDADLDPAKSITAEFTVPYEPGTLTALASSGNRELGRCELATAGPAATIVAKPEQRTAHASRATVVFIPISIIDSRGITVPEADRTITCQVRGEAELQALGTGNPTQIESLSDSHTTTYHGRALLVVRSSGRPGRAQITVSAPGLPEARAEVDFTSEAVDPSTPSR
ncbi:beta-galactosidase BoGH2A precursor [mine drainage metagenome]|uniref:Beta-galactosidase BoGH2A n=1 Tax=mine drainage metagenome TaxID=410659 RepID=A0A1J5RD76_9ZZZZ